MHKICQVTIKVTVCYTNKRNQHTKYGFGPLNESQSGL